MLNFIWLIDITKYSERVEKQANLIRLLLFFAKSDFLCYIKQRRDDLILQKRFLPLCLEQFNNFIKKIFID
jgi:hypothetical protein